MMKLLHKFDIQRFQTEIIKKGEGEKREEQVRMRGIRGEREGKRE